MVLSPSAALVVTASASTALRGSALARVVPPPMIAFATCLALSNAGIIPACAPAYDVATSRALPVSVGLSLLSSAQPVPRICRALVPTAQAFGLVSAGTTLGAIAAFALVTRTGLLAVPQAACAAGCLCATYIGGTANLLAVAAATGARAHCALLPSLLAADAAFMGCHFALLAWASTSRPAQRAFAAADTPDPGAAEATAAGARPNGRKPALAVRWGVPAAGAAVAVAAGLGATWLETAALLPTGGALALICLVCAASAAAASATPAAATSLRSPALPAELLSCLFLGSLGAGTDLRAVTAAGPAAALMCADKDASG